MAKRIVHKKHKQPKLTTQQIIYEIARICYLSKKEAKKVFSAMMEAMKEALLDGEYIWVRGFGKLKWRHFKPRKIWDERNNKWKKVTPKSTIYFKRDRSLRIQLYDDKENNRVAKNIHYWRKKKREYDKKHGIEHEREKNRRYYHSKKRKALRNKHKIKVPSKQRWA